METRTLGRTGLEVSRLGFGTAPLGLQGYLTREDRDSGAFRAEAVAALREAVDRGVTYFDTAPGYGDGRAERILGEALDGRRGRAVIGTKYFYRPDWRGEQYTAALRESLDRLRVERVDLLQFHGGFFGDDRADEILVSGVLDWAEQMKADGLCRAAGLTAEGPSGALERLLRTRRFDTLQVGYNLIYQCCCDYQREPRGIIPLARSLGMGILTMRTATSDFLQRLLGRELGADPGQVTRLAIQFVLSTPEVDCAIVGMRNRDEVAANVELADDLSQRLDLPALHERYP